MPGRTQAYANVPRRPRKPSASSGSTTSDTRTRVTVCLSADFDLMQITTTDWVVEHRQRTNIVMATIAGPDGPELMETLVGRYNSVQEAAQGVLDFLDRHNLEPAGMALPNSQYMESSRSLLESLARGETFEEDR